MAQQGGALTLPSFLTEQFDSPYRLMFGVVLILSIVYAPIISGEIRSFADSVLGRIFVIGMVYVVAHSMGWVYGLLTAMAFLLLINGASRTLEGFDGGGTVSEKKTVKKQWFVESILGEKPKKIAVDRIMTSAIED